MKRDLDISGSYRFVRYLPEYLWIGHSTKQELEEPKINHPNPEAPKILTKPQGKIKVRYGFVPDRQNK